MQNMMLANPPNHPSHPQAAMPTVQPGTGPTVQPGQGDFSKMNAAFNGASRCHVVLVFPSHFHFPFSLSGGGMNAAAIDLLDLAKVAGSGAVILDLRGAKMSSLTFTMQLPGAGEVRQAAVSKVSPLFSSQAAPPAPSTPLPPEGGGGA